LRRWATGGPPPQGHASKDGGENGTFCCIIRKEKPSIPPRVASGEKKKIQTRKARRETTVRTARLASKREDPRGGELQPDNECPFSQKKKSRRAKSRRKKKSHKGTRKKIETLVGKEPFTQTERRKGTKTGGRGSAQAGKKLTA